MKQHNRDASIVMVTECDRDVERNRYNAGKGLM